MSLKDREWWPALIDRLRFEPLPVLAREFGENLVDLYAELASIGADGPAQQTPWWPEARRLRNTTPIREIARRFHTNARRIRRAMARTSLRVGGRELGSRGLPELQAFRDQLGRVPDWRIARAAKVTVWAVQGERRRSNIPGFRPRPGAGKRGLSQDEEAWILGPARPRRDRMRVDSEAVQVVRRPVVRAGDSPRPVGTTQPTPPRPTLESAPEPGFRPALPRPTGTRRIIRPEEPVLAPTPAPAPTVIRRPRRGPETTWRPVDPQVLERTEERVPPQRRPEPVQRPAPWTPATATSWQPPAAPERRRLEGGGEHRPISPPRIEAEGRPTGRPSFPSVEGYRPPTPVAAPLPEPIRKRRGRPPKPRPELSETPSRPVARRVEAPTRPDPVVLPAPTIRPAPSLPAPTLQPTAPVARAPVMQAPATRTPVVPVAPIPPLVAPARPIQRWLAQGPEGLRLQIDAPDVFAAALRLKSILPPAQLAQIALVRM